MIFKASSSCRFLLHVQNGDLEIWLPAKWIPVWSNHDVIIALFTYFLHQGDQFWWEEAETDQICNCLLFCFVQQMLLEVNKKLHVQILVLKDSSPTSIGGGQRQIFTLILRSGAWLWLNVNVASICWISNSLLTLMRSDYLPASLLFAPNRK